MHACTYTDSIWVSRVFVTPSLWNPSARHSPWVCRNKDSFIKWLWFPIQIYYNIFLNNEFSLPTWLSFCECDICNCFTFNFKMYATTWPSLIRRAYPSAFALLWLLVSSCCRIAFYPEMILVSVTFDD